MMTIRERNVNKPAFFNQSRLGEYFVYKNIQYLVPNVQFITYIQMFQEQIYHFEREREKKRPHTIQYNFSSTVSVYTNVSIVLLMN